MNKVLRAQKEPPRMEIMHEVYATFFFLFFSLSLCPFYAILRFSTRVFFSSFVVISGVLITLKNIRIIKVQSDLLRVFSSSRNTSNVR